MYRPECNPGQLCDMESGFIYGRGECKFTFSGHRIRSLPFLGIVLPIQPASLRHNASHLVKHLASLGIKRHVDSEI